MTDNNNDLTPEEHKLIRVFNLGVEQVIFPLIEDLKKELIAAFRRELKTEIQPVKDRLDQIDQKLDITHAKTLDHDSRLNTLETLPVIAHQLKTKK